MSDDISFEEVPPNTTDETPRDIDAESLISEEAPYGYTTTGRIRKRPLGSRARGGPSGEKGNAVLARRAANVLGTLNSVTAGSLYVLGMRDTASAIAQHNDDFENKAAMALANDPKLCRTLLRGGEASSKLLLVAAYGSLAMAVAPVARREYSELKAQRQAGIEEPE